MKEPIEDLRAYFATHGEEDNYRVAKREAFRNGTNASVSVRTVAVRCLPWISKAPIPNAHAPRAE